VLVVLDTGAGIDSHNIGFTITYIVIS